MLSELRPYYEEELGYLRTLGKEFADQFPGIASRLHIDGERAEDPHVERLLQGFAFLTARIHRKLDDEFPQITDALFNVLYPHYLRPVPSMSIAQFAVDPDNVQITGRYRVERHSQLFAQPVGSAHGVQCRFRTCYPVDLWPIRIADTKFEPIERSPFVRRGAGARGVVRIKIAGLGKTDLGELGIDRLRFFLDGEPSTAHALYELLLNGLTRVVVRTGDQPGSEVVLPPNVVQAVGFAPDEGLLDYDPRSFLGYRLLHEYFAFPEKFLFVDVTGLAAALGGKRIGKFEIAFVIGEGEADERLMQLGQSIGAHSFKLGCTPIVNLFAQMAEPLRLTHEKFEYPVIPDARRKRAMEVYSVDSVRKSVKSNGQDRLVEYLPFYSCKHGLAEATQATYWYANRRHSPVRDDAGTDVYLSLVDLDFNPTLPDAEVLHIGLTCTNRDVPSQLPFGGYQSDLEMEGAAAISRIRLLRKPTSSMRPPLGRGAVWRLISHLSLNHLSIVDAGREALLEILNLYNFANSPATRSQIAGIVGLRSRPDIARIGPGQRGAFVRGTRVELEFDEAAFAGSGAYLFAKVLDHFLGLYCALNSYVRLSVRTRQRERELVTWPPRSGEQILV